MKIKTILTDLIKLYCYLFNINSFLLLTPPPASPQHVKAPPVSAADGLICQAADGWNQSSRPPPHHRPPQQQQQLFLTESAPSQPVAAAVHNPTESLEDRRGDVVQVGGGVHLDGGCGRSALVQTRSAAAQCCSNTETPSARSRTRYMTADEVIAWLVNTVDGHMTSGREEKPRSYSCAHTPSCHSSRCCFSFYTHTHYFMSLRLSLRY